MLESTKERQEKLLKTLAAKYKIAEKSEKYNLLKSIINNKINDAEIIKAPFDAAAVFVETKFVKTAKIAVKPPAPVARTAAVKQAAAKISIPVPKKEIQQVPLTPSSSPVSQKPPKLQEIIVPSDVKIKQKIVLSSAVQAQIDGIIKVSEQDPKDIAGSFAKVLSATLGEERDGRFFEIYSFNLLKKYYRACNVSIIKSESIGGPDDNGIDAKLETVDWLGFRDYVFVQAKIRASEHITMNEARQFYGAMCAHNGTKGIFITNSVFHSEAEKYILGIKNLIAIDKYKIYELAKLCQYGIYTEHGRDWIDINVFDQIQ